MPETARRPGREWGREWAWMWARERVHPPFLACEAGLGLRTNQWDKPTPMPLPLKEVWREFV